MCLQLPDAVERYVNGLLNRLPVDLSGFKLAIDCATAPCTRRRAALA